MRHPAYHLRPNKAIDRLALIEAIGRLGKLEPAGLADYVYYGLGGPYMEDFREVHEQFPRIAMVSVEEDEETIKRQQFHLPCSTVRLERATMKEFIGGYEPKGPGIFWLDYTGLEYGQFEDFMALLPKAIVGTMVKITLRSEPKDHIDQPGSGVGTAAELFRRRFGVLMPDGSVDPPRAADAYAALLQDMIRVAAEKALPSAMPQSFQMVSSFFYSDGTGMLTVTGVVCQRGAEGRVKAAFRDWHLANLQWSKPRRLDVPVLSTKERLHLQKLLPCARHAGRRLREELGYLIDETRSLTEQKLEQYSEYHQYYPFFMRGTP